METQFCLDKIKDGDNILIIGDAKSGKSHLIETILYDLHSNLKYCTVLCRMSNCNEYYNQNVCLGYYTNIIKNAIEYKADDKIVVIDDCMDKSNLKSNEIKELLNNNSITTIISMKCPNEINIETYNLFNHIFFLKTKKNNDIDDYFNEFSDKNIGNKFANLTDRYESIVVNIHDKKYNTYYYKAPEYLRYYKNY